MESMGSKINSFEEKIKLPVTETISRFYQPQRNRKAIRILTVAVYVLCVSLAAIMLSLYYIFIWDPMLKPFVPKVNSNCEKIIIPEHIVIRLLNSTEITADQFYKNILDYHNSLQLIEKKTKLKNNLTISPAYVQNTTQQQKNYSTEQPQHQPTSKPRLLEKYTKDHPEALRNYHPYKNLPVNDVSVDDEDYSSDITTIDESSGSYPYLEDNRLLRYP